MNISRFLATVIIGTGLSLIGYQSTFAQGMSRGTATIVAETLCGGIHFLRPSGDFLVGVINLRNIDARVSIEILDIRAWDEDGNLIYESELTGFPTNPRFKPVLLPFQSSVFFSSEIVPLGTLSLQVRITYGYSLVTGNPLLATSVFSSSIGNFAGPIQARSSRECTNVTPA